MFFLLLCCFCFVVWLCSFSRKSRLIPRPIPGIRVSSDYQQITGHLSVFWKRYESLNTYFLENMQYDPTTPYQTLLPMMPPVVTIPPTIEAARLLLHDNFHDYTKDKYLSSCFGELFGNGIFASDGDTWRAQRKIASRIFSKRYHTSYMLPAFEKCTHHLVSRLQDMNGEVVDMQELFLEVTMHAMVDIAFEGAISAKDRSKMGPAFDMANRCMFKRMVKPWWKLSYYVNVCSKNERNIKKSIATINDICYSSLRNNNNNNNSNSESLVALWKTYLPDCTEKDLRDLIVNFLVAGRDTTATAMTWCLYMIATNTTVQKKYRGLVTEKAKDVFLDAIVLETLRLYPPIPNDVKQVSVESTPLNSSCGGEVISLPRYTTVAYRPYLFGRSDAIWGHDAASFVPERWITRMRNGDKAEEEKEDEEDVIDTTMLCPYQFLTFNAGYRKCLGMDMARSECRIMLKAIIETFDDIVFMGTRDDVTWTPGITLFMKNGLQMLFRKRFVGRSGYT